MKLLLISNSTNAGEGFLEHARDMIREFAGTGRPKAVFIPYAAVTISFEVYSERVLPVLRELGIDCRSVHLAEDPVAEIEKAEMIIVGGGNTFHLLDLMQTNGILEPIRKRVKQGIPYLGWSAGANVTCPTICTTNDMPVIEPESFRACNLVPFQINPHYLDVNPEGHAGETREQRILEYLEVNRERYVVGLREGTALSLEGGNLRLLGKRNARIFKYGLKPMELGSGSDFQFLLR
ncbi:MAG: dipeptidase PepE [Bacteroidales bacterium]